MPGRNGANSGLLGGLLSAGIGLAAEAIEHQRNKSRSPGSSRSDVPALSPQPRSTSSREVQYGPPASPPPAYSEYTEDEHDQLSKNSVLVGNENVIRDDEAVWELDEADKELRQLKCNCTTTQRAEIPKGIMKDPAKISVLVDAFVLAYPTLQADNLSLLPCPVVIPQKRPGTRERGFVRAYAPLMEPCGIDQATWLRFLDFYDESLQYSNIIRVVKIAADVAGLIPSASAFAASLAVKTAASVAGGMQSRQRSNDFISQMNERWFIPIGMVCMILRYTPNAQDGGFDLQKSAQSTTSSARFNFENAHGSTTEAEIPMAAPLIFPEIDRAAGYDESADDRESMASDRQEKLGKLARSRRFVADYMDRRARASFAVENPRSQLAEAVQDGTRFESSLGHPGSLDTFRRRDRTRLSTSEHAGGGRRQRHRRGENAGRTGRLRSDRLHSNTADLADDTGTGRPRRYDRAGTSREGGALSLVKKVFQKDILYMLVVPLPSQEEVRRYSSTLPPDVTVEDMYV